MIWLESDKKTITWKDSYNIHVFFEVFPLLCPKGKWKMFFRWKTFLHGPSSLGKLVFLSPCCPQTLLNLLHPSQFQQKEYRVECCKNTKYKNTKYFVDCREKQNWKIKILEGYENSRCAIFWRKIPLRACTPTIGWAKKCIWQSNGTEVPRKWKVEGKE